MTTVGTFESDESVVRLLESIVGVIMELLLLLFGALVCAACLHVHIVRERRIRTKDLLLVVALGVEHFLVSRPLSGWTIYAEHGLVHQLSPDVVPPEETVVLLVPVSSDVLEPGLACHLFGKEFIPVAVLLVQVPDLVNPHTG